MLLIGAAFASDTGNSSVNVTVESPPLACSVLSTGGVYNLTQNVSVSGANCFNVTGSSVTIDCNGYTISGNNASGTIGIFGVPGTSGYGKADNYAIKNCNIVGFDTGINIYGSGGTIKDTNITSSTYGIYLDNVWRTTIIGGVNAYATSNNAFYTYGWAGGSEGGNIVANSTFTSENGVVVNDYQIHGSGSLSFINNTFISGDGTHDLVEANDGGGNCAGVPTFYWNNFTATSGKYINSSCSLALSATVGGHSEGNIYANVLDHSITVFGTSLSTGYPALYYGTSGAVPYNSSNSGSKIDGAIGDAAPLTNQVYVAYNPVVETVTMTNSSLDPTPCSTTSVPVIQMNVSDGNGYADITTASAYVNISNGGVTHQTTGCIVDSSNGNWVMLNCTGAAMNFYDVAAANWTVTGYAIDSTSLSNTTAGSNMTYNTGIHMVLENDPLTFGTIYSGTNNNTNTNSPALDVKNCGNAALNMTVTGANITDGGSNSIPVGSFRVSNNGTSGAGTELTLTEAAQSYSIGASGLAAGSSSTKALYSFLNVPIGQAATTYNTGTWAFIVSNYE